MATYYCDENCRGHENDSLADLLKHPNVRIASDGSFVPDRHDRGEDEE